MPPTSSSEPHGPGLSSPECSHGPAPTSVCNGVWNPVPAYLVELELCDDDLGSGNGDRDRLAVALLADDCVIVSVV